MHRNEEKMDIDQEVEGQHNAIQITNPEKYNHLRNNHPDAQWFPNAGLGLFLHWGISAVSAAFDLSWSMITGWDFTKRDLSQEEINQIIAEGKYGGSEPGTTPAEYFKLAERFKAENYDPDKWMSAAKKAGFKYAVLTAKHHDGFALWPSEFGEFSTKNFLGGRDLVQEYVDACRKHGIRVGLYYSPPDWYFNRKHMSYLIYTAKKRNPGLPDLDENHHPVNLPDAAEMAVQNKKYGIHARGQIEELLTRYGKIDLLWFDGGMPSGEVYPMERIRKLQPGIVVNTRLHGDGDFKNCEVKFADEKPLGWWEYCTIWCIRKWAYVKGLPYRPTSEIISEFVKTRAWGGNFLLDIGPMANGEFPEAANKGMAELTEWTRIHGESVFGVTSLPVGEQCSIPAVANGTDRYLYILPDFHGRIEYSGIDRPSSVCWLADSTQLEYSFHKEILNIELLDQVKSELVRVIKIKTL